MMEAVFLLIVLGVGAAIIGARGVAHERHGRDRSEDCQ